MADNTTQESAPAMKALTVSVVALAALRLLSPYIPADRLWGLDYIVYVPFWLTLAASLAMVAIVLPPVRDPLLRWYGGLGERELRNGYFILSGAGALAIILFPMETFFHGDGGMFVGEVFKIVNVAGYEPKIFLDFKSTPLSGLALYAISYILPDIAKGLGLYDAFRPLFPFRAVSFIAFAALAAGIYNTMDARYRIPSLLFILGTAGALLLFGYVEMYAFVFVAVALYGLISIRYLEGKSSKAAVAGSYIIAIICHYYVIALLPSLLFLLLKDRLPEKRTTVSAAWIAVGSGLAVFTVVYFLSGLYATDNRIVIPFVEIASDTGVNRYTLLASAHLADLVNLFLLLAPLPLGFIVFRMFAKEKRPENSQAKVFFILAAGFFSVFVLFANTLYGLGRDWDLTAPLGVLLALAAFALIRNSAANTSGKAFVFSLATLLWILPWLTVNISTEGSKSRMGYLIEQDVDNIFPYLTMVGYEAMRKQFLHEKDYDRELEYLIKMIRLQDYPETYNLLENSLYANFYSETDTIVKYNKWMIHRLDSLAGLLQSGGYVYKWQNLKFIDSLVAGIGYYAYLNKRLDVMQTDIQSFVQHRKLNTVLHVLNGMESYRKTEFGKAAYHLEQASGNDFMTAKLAGMYGDALMQIGAVRRSDSVFTAMFEKFPDDAELRVIRAFSLVQRGARPDDARRYLQEAIALQPDETLLRTIDALYNRLEGQKPGGDIGR